MRPKKLSDDFTNTLDVMKHAIKLIKKRNKINLKVVCCIYATAPFMKKEDLIKALNLLTPYSVTTARVTIESSAPKFVFIDFLPFSRNYTLPPKRSTCCSA